MNTNEALQVIQKIGSRHLFPKFTTSVHYLNLLNLSFSVAGEDLWLRQYMKEKLRAGQPGFYVDIGAFDPVYLSNTFLFYCYGWRGICVDATSQFEELFAAHRPRDVFVRGAVTNSAKTIYFGQHKTNHGMSKISESTADFDKDFTRPVIVPKRTLAEILDQHVPAGMQIDFMSIDIENSELPALQSNNWDKNRPRVILIEAHGFDIDKPYDYPTVSFLHSKGYQFEGFSNMNVLMLDGV